MKKIVCVAMVLALLCTNTIKYWSSHGSNSGQLWGTESSADINIFNQNFLWAGGNLEFAFLAACRQLDGSGSNPRKRYANAMIGSKAVRVICGNSTNKKKMAFVYNKNSGYYEPSWIFTTADDSTTYEVNCLSGMVQTSDSGGVE